jgi:hypothetical protein
MTLQASLYALGVAVLAFAQPAWADTSLAPCFSGYQPARAAPYHVNHWAGQGSHSVLAGARVFFRAEPALTAEWLHHRLDQRRAEKRATSHCPLDVSGARLRVTSAGPGFWVTVSAKPGVHAREVWRRAQALIAD